MDKKQKQMAMVAGAIILIYLAYRYYQSNQAAATTTGAVAPDTSGADYASLAGQEQSDVAALQGQNQQLAGQQTADEAQEASDVNGLTAALGTVTTGVANLTGAQSALTQQVASIAAGVQKVQRTQTATAPTHKGGPFYRYYKSVTGKAPPANIATSNFIYEAWKSGVKATAIKPAPHPSSKNTQIHHPNANHTAQTAKHPSSDKKHKAPAKTKSKASGTRK